MTVELRWRASPLTRAIATCAGVAIVGALIAGRWELIAFAAPLLGVLCSIGFQRGTPTVEVGGQPDLQRCFESERVQISVGAQADDGSPVALTCSALTGMNLEVISEAAGSGLGQTVAVQAARWGRYPVRASVRVLGRGGLLEGTGTA